MPTRLKAALLRILTAPNSRYKAAVSAGAQGQALQGHQTLRRGVARAALMRGTLATGPLLLITALPSRSQLRRKSTLT